MHYKTPFILVLIGVILGGVNSVWKLISYFIAKAMSSSMGTLYESFSIFGLDYSTLYSYILLFSLVRAIIGLVLTLILVFYVFRIAKSPAKTDFIVTIVLGILGVLSGMGFIAGVLTLVGGIVGVMQVNKEGNHSAPKSRKTSTRK